MRKLTSPAVRVIFVASAFAFSVPISAAPSGEVFVKLPPGKCSASDPGKFGNWIADVERPAEASKERVAGSNELQAEREKEPAAHHGRGIDIARVDGEIVSPGSPAGSSLPAGKRQDKTVALAGPDVKTGCR